MPKTVEELEDIIKKYEENGPNKLYYALSRKSWEMADLLNSVNLKNLTLDDPKDKTFDRLKVIWNDASSIAIAVKALGDASGITGNETEDVLRSKKPFTPELIADAVGELAGKKY